MRRPYPTGQDGFPLHLSEIVHPASELPDHPSIRENHHMLFSARFMGQLVMTQVLRDLAAYQEITLTDTHDWVHASFKYPVLPKLTVIMNRLETAYDGGEQRRFGTANRFRYEPITDELWQSIQDEYSVAREQVL